MINLETHILELIKPYIDSIIDQKISARIEEVHSTSGITLTDELPLSMKEFSTRIGLSKSFLYQQVSQNKSPITNAVVGYILFLLKSGIG
jgi:hypothetical protein